jgi:hypothetical protein
MLSQLIRQHKFLILDSIPSIFYMNLHQFYSILFIYLLVAFLTTWSGVKTTWWRMVGWLYEVWKILIVAQSEVLPQHMPGDRRKSMRNLSQVSQTVGQDLNSRPLKYEVECYALTCDIHFLYCTFTCQQSSCQWRDFSWNTLSIKCLGIRNCKSQNYCKHGSGKKILFLSVLKFYLIYSQQPYWLSYPTSIFPNTQLKLIFFDKVYYMLKT